MVFWCPIDSLCLFPYRKDLLYRFLEAQEVVVDEAWNEKMIENNSALVYIWSDFHQFTIKFFLLTLWAFAYCLLQASSDWHWLVVDGVSAVLQSERMGMYVEDNLNCPMSRFFVRSCTRWIWTASLIHLVNLLLSLTSKGYCHSCTMVCLNSLWKEMSWMPSSGPSGFFYC